MSALLDDCLTQRRDLVFGGTRYNLPGVSIMGNSNVYDGMMAIRKLVCDEKRLTWGDLRRALLEDFKGHEQIQQMLSHRAPRFGNDEPEVDALANRINAVHADFFWRHVDARNGRYTCGVWPVEGHVHSGTWTAATPDGRRSGAPIVDGVGACHGADKSGPTALLKSVAQLNHSEHWAAGNTCNIKFSKTAMQTDQALDRLKDLTTTYMRLKGQQLQINAVDAETLRDAQAHPDQYENLIVRVAGFSAYFTQLNARVQEEIISRTEQSL